MKKLYVVGMVLVVFLMTGAVVQGGEPTEHTFDAKGYTKVAKKSIGACISGDVDAEKMIADMVHLVELGIAGCEEHMEEEETPAQEKTLMEIVAAQAKTMSSLSLAKIEELWHDGGYAKSKGIDIHGYDHFAEVMCHYDAVVHPATVIICLQEYQKDQNEEHLEQIKDELSEVVEHLKHLD